MLQHFVCGQSQTHFPTSHEILKNGNEINEQRASARGGAVPAGQVKGNEMNISKIIDGLRYNTATAEEICSFESESGEEISVTKSPLCIGRPGDVSSSQDAVVR